jgi:hemin uptake protein HemP
VRNTQRDGFEERMQVRDEGLQTPWIDSRAILGDRDEVLIRHGDQVYRLRKTRYGKLILNK